MTKFSHGHSFEVRVTKHMLKLFGAGIAVCPVRWAVYEHMLALDKALAVSLEVSKPDAYGLTFFTASFSDGSSIRGDYFIPRFEASAIKSGRAGAALEPFKVTGAYESASLKPVPGWNKVADAT